LHDLSPAGVIDGIAALTGPFGPVALVAIAVSAVAINSINDNTAAYSLISTGVRIPRHVSAIVTSLCGFALAVAGAGKFADLFSNYLLLLLYWIAPWAGIVLTDWLLHRGRAGARARGVRARRSSRSSRRDDRALFGDGNLHRTDRDPPRRHGHRLLRGLLRRIGRVRVVRTAAFGRAGSGGFRPGLVTRRRQRPPR
jgi:hypothetical protein